MTLAGAVSVEAIDVVQLQQRLRDQGADPGDRPSANARILEMQA